MGAAAETPGPSASKADATAAAVGSGGARGVGEQGIRAGAALRRNCAFQLHQPACGNLHRATTTTADATAGAHAARAAIAAETPVATLAASPAGNNPREGVCLDRLTVLATATTAATAARLAAAPGTTAATRPTAVSAGHAEVGQRVIDAACATSARPAAETRTAVLARCRSPAGRAVVAGKNCGRRPMAGACVAAHARKAGGRAPRPGAAAGATGAAGGGVCADPDVTRCR